MEKERRASYTPVGSQESVIIDLLLEEMQRVPLLTKEEEVTLFKKIEAGREAETKIVATNGNLQSQERERMLLLAEEGKNAKEHVILANLRLVMSIAKVNQGKGLPLLDLFQGGTKGLIRATEKFDYRMGNKFSTYATFWIRQAIQRDVADNGRTIRIPIHTQDKLWEILRTVERLTQELGRRPTIGEISQSAGLAKKKVQNLLSAGSPTLSLDTPFGEEEESTLGELIPSNGNGNPQQSLETEMLSYQTRQLLSLLNVREERVIRMRHALDGKKFTLEEIAQSMGITKQRVSQIEIGALSKMRDLAYLLGLSEFLN